MRKSQETLAELFGCNVFSDDVMRVRLPQTVYEQLRRTMDEGARLDPSIAEVVAGAMKEWAVEKGATHYTHWFQPLHGKTAEKYDAFLSPLRQGGAMMEFSGKELIRGESDASSFPSGGLRATFEARGYTTWDCTSPAFIREDPDGLVALCIPTAFCSYGGQALDLRTPLLRSMQCLSKQAVRMLRALGDTATRRVYAAVGVEQEYFLVDRDHYRSRRDLIYTGRTLLGARPPKGQDMDDQYYAVIRQRVSAFMSDLNIELWKLGVAAKTQHNESAPAQHEVAVLFNNANIASDQNQLTLMMLGKVAARHELACLVHEKPFEGVNGSGKHDNWSLATDTGVNLLSPGDEPEHNLRFMLCFMAVIAALNEHAPLLRAACASASNDQRLGSHEAPPPVVSAFVGDRMLEILDALEGGDEPCHERQSTADLGVDSLAALMMDNTDRNRTAPFAFTGNKFELRMLGSSQSPSSVNTYLNVMVAEQLSQIADALEGAEDVQSAGWAMVKKLIRDHRRVIFNGNAYSPEWREEAARRGLPCAPSTVEAAHALSDPKHTALLSKYAVLTHEEQVSRSTILLDTYMKMRRIEARTLSEMAHTLVAPAILRWQGELARTALDLAEARAAVPSEITAGDAAMVAPSETAKRGPSGYTYMTYTQLDWLSARARLFQERLDALDRLVAEGPVEPCAKSAAYWKDRVLPAMDALREVSDEIETRMPRDRWPLVTYGELLFYK